MKYFNNPDYAQQGERYNREIYQLRIIIVPSNCQHTTVPTIAVIYYDPVADEEVLVSTDMCKCPQSRHGKYPDSIDLTIDVYPGHCCGIADPVVRFGLLTLFRQRRSYRTHRPCEHRRRQYQP